eukprot:CAMPEP_0168535044 /NCGR_PEP_ID=MMETSP0405-20121227/18391_1 /TAXON_ID=498012 /ORGANISM="Trichosphaerium sp, Strain Am-I-7 wt" /LENGTH=881 /DNA_ID=CAMNT_0008562127 /DNA_START=27 /DNA_END=2671 /DNA_ORIENTATION=+
MERPLKRPNSPRFIRRPRAVNFDNNKLSRRRPRTPRRQKTRSMSTPPVPTKKPTKLPNVHSRTDSSMDSSHSFIPVVEDTHCFDQQAIKVDDKSVPFMLESILRIMGYDKSRSREITRQIAKDITAQDGYDRRVSKLKYVIDTAQRSLDYHTQLAEVVKLQSWIRGYKVQVLDLPGIRERKGKHFDFLKLIGQEQTFVNRMDDLTKVYIAPLQIKSRLVSQDDLSIMSVKIPELHKKHTSLLSKLYTVRDNWPNISGVRAVINEMAQRSVYVPYIKNVRHALNTLKRLKKSNPELITFLDTQRQQTLTKETMFTLLADPVSHLQSVHATIQSLSSNTPATDPDYDALAATAAYMEKVMRWVKHYLKYSRNWAVIKDMQRKLGGLSDLPNPRREFLAEYDVTYKKRSSKCYIFNDLLIVATGRIKEDTPTYKAKIVCSYKDMSVPSQTAKQPGDTALGFVHEAKKYVLYFTSMEFRDTVWKAIYNLTECCSGKCKVFGTPLSRVVNYQSTVNGVPNVVRCMQKYLLMGDHVRLEGIFRVPGDNTAIEELINEFNFSEHMSAVDLYSYDAHTIAGVLKSFFRRMPEPVLTYKLFDSFLKVADEQDSQTLIKKVKKLVDQIPTANRRLLRSMLKFLKKVSSYSDANMMGIPNLAIVFGNNFMFPKQDPTSTTTVADISLRTTLNIDKVVRVVSCMIESYEEIIPSTKSTQSPIKKKASGRSLLSSSSSGSSRKKKRIQTIELSLDDISFLKTSRRRSAPSWSIDGTELSPPRNYPKSARNTQHKRLATSPEGSHNFKLSRSSSDLPDPLGFGKAAAQNGRFRDRSSSPSAPAEQKRKKNNRLSQSFKSNPLKGYKDKESKNKSPRNGAGGIRGSRKHKKSRLLS